jgi:hypothetical protein
MDIFEQVSEQIKKTEEQWKNIDQLVAKIKAEPTKTNCSDLACLVLLLVEQLRPVGNLGQEASKLQNEITQMLNVFSGGKK